MVILDFWYFFVLLPKLKIYPRNRNLCYQDTFKWQACRISKQYLNFWLWICQDNLHNPKIQIENSHYTGMRYLFLKLVSCMLVWLYYKAWQIQFYHTFFKSWVKVHNLYIIIFSYPPGEPLALRYVSLPDSCQ